MIMDNQELQYLAHKLLYNNDGQRFLELLKRYFSRHAVLPAQPEILKQFADDITAYLSYHEGMGGLINHIENLMEGFANELQHENSQGTKHE